MSSKISPNFPTTLDDSLDRSDEQSLSMRETPCAKLQHRKRLESVNSTKLESLKHGTRKLSFDRKKILDDNYSPLEIKPKFSGVEVSAFFRKQLEEIAQTPLEVYENNLYSLTATYMLVLGGISLSLESLDRIHHIFQLKSAEDQLSTDEIYRLNLNVERVIEDSPLALEEYKLLSGLIYLSGSLLVKWNMVRWDDYFYRLGGRAMNVILLDLYKLNENTMVPEVFWFSIVINDYPLNQYIEDSVKQYAIVLQQQAITTFNYMLHMNTTDFRKCPSIEGYLAAQHADLRTKFNLKANHHQYPPDYYQELKQPEGFIAKCLKTRGQARAMVLKKHLQDLSYAYRAFEKALIGSMLDISVEPSQIDDSL